MNFPQFLAVERTVFPKYRTKTYSNCANMYVFFPCNMSKFALCSLSALPATTTDLLHKQEKRKMDPVTKKYLEGGKTSQAVTV